jgi:hypothetical protein
MQHPRERGAAHINLATSEDDAAAREPDAVTPRDVF